MISFPTGRNHHHSTPIISLHAHQKQQRKNVVCLHCVANCLHLCFSTGAASFTTGLDSGQEQRKKKKSILYSLSFLLVISWLGLLVSFIKLRWGGKCIFQQTNSSIASCTGFLCWLLPLLSCKWRKKNPLAPWREILASVQQVSLQAMAHMHSQSHLSTAGGHCMQWVGWGKQVNMGKGTAGLRHKPALYKRNQKSKGKLCSAFSLWKLRRTAEWQDLSHPELWDGCLLHTQSSSDKDEFTKLLKREFIS